MKLSDLSPGERTYTLRKRMGYTQAAMAEAIGDLTRKELIAIERDRSDVVTLDRIDVACKNDMSLHEQARILRRRSGLSRVALAAQLCVSPYWLTQMESGKAGICQKKLAEFWGNALN